MPDLFMVLAGSSMRGRNTEQHDVFFGIGESMRDIAASLPVFWPEAGEKLHVDAWRRVRSVDGFAVSVTTQPGQVSTTRLFFLNLGGYKKDQFEEFHYKMIVAADNKGEAVRMAKETAFYRHTGFTGATSHIDDRYGIDVDDIYEIADILSPADKEQYSISVTRPADPLPGDEIHLGYFKLNSF